MKIINELIYLFHRSVGKPNEVIDLPNETQSIFYYNFGLFTWEVICHEYKNISQMGEELKKSL